ncbi:AMP-binding protein [Pseudoteredinibacter isoporae]|uniref:D-alanine--poly(Phosphoribitol) ligase subunit 1 n=1 Tax=Pseudoteredinibacter isoporae TaxID=570281 RepID=A0A7X0MWA3_9GAMM|nr:AMP-binding protein [Pseudoteredinibacter isoporae]MBB6522258.1 D-alanine--poly(phosphoribitol) ligase subunit 1 [Pseudoteredinibacter isoporae]NHO87791.1 D-alanine--poly(phosphoribitol) ligase [Pseudoteredinibacter isoporae]NIB23878.1 D-alanine--poly(phosphoribitol) ligase [Pseudoteredinibacter isoporae]
MFDINTLPLGEQPAIVSENGLISWSAFHTTYDTVHRKITGLLKEKHRAIVLLHDSQAEQTPDMAIYILVALSLKIPFVPLDRNLPYERIRYIFSLIGCGIHVDCYDGSCKVFDRKLSTRPDIPDETAYIIFTSGTTGDPKGVMIDRDAIAAFCRWFEADFPNLENPVFTLSASYSFDLSLMSIFPFLAKGSCLWINSQSDKLSDLQIPKPIQGREIHWVSTPSYLMLQLLSREFNDETMAGLKVFNFCGEPLEQNLVRKLKQRFPKARIFNSYGPTEATIAVSTVEITDIDAQSYRNRLPIGKRTHLLSVLEHTNEGELLISGNQVMSGYIGQQEQSHAPEGRVYASGDVVEEHAGLLYLLDRVDAQIKYRGYRIDLAEIDAILSDHPNIQFAKTIAVTRQETIVRIVSFCVIDPEHHYSENRLKTLLSKRLPHYAIPNEIRRVDALPITQRHKLDTAALLQLSAEPA